MNPSSERVQSRFLRNVSHLLQKGMRILGRGSHFLLSISIIFTLAYLLGFTLIDGPLQGNDTPLHVSYAKWFNENFPDIPHWYPLHGGGVSLLHGYPILPHLMIVSVHRLTGLSIPQTIRLISFLTIPLTAVGIYLLCCSLYRRQNLGLIAAVFFILAPVSWTWIHDWGFFPQQVGYVFLPLILLAFDRTERHYQNPRSSGRRRLWFVVLVLLVFVAILCHVMVAAAATVAIALFIFFSFLIAKRGKHRKNLLSSLKVLGLLGLTVGLLSAGYLVPFFNYGNVANREGLNTPPAHQLHRLPIAEFFGLSAIAPDDVLTRMQIPLVVTIFAGIGLGMGALLGLRGGEKPRKALALALSALVATIYTLSPSLVAIVLNFSPLLVNFLNFRTFLLADMLLMPLTAAFGVWTLAETLIYPDKMIGLLRQEQPQKPEHRLSPRPTLASLLALVIASVAIFYIGEHPQGNLSALPYGPIYKGIDLEDIWQRGGDFKGESLGTQLQPENWPGFTIHDVDGHIDQSTHIAAQLPQGNHLRIDISPHHGRLAMDLVNFADVSQINTYTFQINLIHAMWGYQQNAFFSREAAANEYGNPTTLNSLAQWFGIEYVMLDSQLDSYEMYEAAGWELIFEEETGQWWRNPHAPGMASAFNHPAILMISQQETDAYMSVFRLANQGMLPYEDAILVEGNPRIDQYTLEDLIPFDIVFLYGYDYKHGDRAWDMINAYVSQGGSVFVDTGWEYWIPEWEFSHAPDVLPVERLMWTDYGEVENLSLDHPEIAGDIDVTLFKPLSWEGNPWTLSGAYSEDVRDWGQVVLSAAGRPLVVAGDYGEGRVVWSGMNLIGHARYGTLNLEEVGFIRNLIDWLIEDSALATLADPIVERSDPDRVHLELQTTPNDITWLYWRESYYPDWHAFLEQGAERVEIPIFRAGPGFMLVPIESTSETALVILEWQPSSVERAASYVSLLGAGLLGAFFLDGLFLHGMLFSWIKTTVSQLMPKPFLGEGSNLEWAEEKRREIEAMKNGFAQPIELLESQPDG